MGLLFRFGFESFASCLYSDRFVSAAWCNVGICVLWLVSFAIFCSVRAFGYYFLSLCLRFILWFQLAKNPTRIPCVSGWSIWVGRLFGFLRAQSGNVWDVGIARSYRSMIHSEPGLHVPGIGIPQYALGCVAQPIRFVCVAWIQGLTAGIRA